jgi:FixJ family two-component response regulator
MFDSQQATVVVIEDDPGLRESMEVLFSAADYRCVSYASAEAYIAQPAPSTPSCVVLDLHLPGMSGIELQSRISGANPRLPVLFLSGDASRAERNQAMAGGAAGFLRKPIDPSVLLSRTQHCLWQSLEPG